MEGRRHFKLVIRKQDGTVRTDYVDASTFLETKWEWQFSNGGKRYTAESWFRDYRTVDGIACAFTVESNTLGTSIRQKIVFSKIEINPAILPGRFGKPE